MKGIFFASLIAMLAAPAMAKDAGQVPPKVYDGIQRTPKPAIQRAQPRALPEQSRTMQARGPGTPPPGLTWHVIQPADFTEEKMYRVDESQLQAFYIGRGPVLRSAHVHPNVWYGAMAAVRLPDGARVRWMECNTEGSGRGDTRITVSLQQHGFNDLHRSHNVMRLSIHAADVGTVRSYRGFASLNPGHRVDNATSFYLLQAKFINEGGTGQGLRACRIGYQ